ncbi:peptidoglycan DD-metalloendopeptidase family protein [Methylobacterium sp. J-076]|uniref:peptidoglycan DD-metalloendopeptidase family protein n=1 Tax=Methylobacterium sp. J-076 TaxID=2836655 RepID=UPI001FB8AD15|nr:peptidoglycan DD-metalloendopeptidase family protein [Methylobacterium sp. J-076]MCJ2013234.1 peptidoglycan DD-metalloendopeptidase family protein [Methylobacterium sp. J-076]
MRVRGAVRGFRTLSRVALVGIIGGGAAACSSDASRLNSPFTNPFSEPAATGSLPDDDVKPVAPLRTGRIQSEALGAPGAGRPAPVASTLPPPAAASPTRVASVGSTGWSAQGGTRITVSKNDSLNQMATRYGVPAAAILQANGLTSASQVTPGRELVIPAYNAVSGLNPSAAAMTARPARAVEEKREDAKVLEAKQARERDARAQEAKAQEAKAQETKAQEAKRLAAREKEAKEAREKEAREAKAQEAKDLATRKAAEAKAAEEKARKLAAVKDSDKKHVRPGQTVKTADAKADKAEKARDEAKEAAKTAAKAEAVQKLAEAKAARDAANDAARETAKQAAAEKAAKADVAKADVAKAETAKASAKAEVAKAEPAKAEPAATGSVAAQASADNFRWPAKGRVIAGYGASGNEGINIALPEGTPVKAAEDGTVAYAGSDVKGYGKLVLVRHSNGYVSAYAHNGELDVKPGDKVKRGQTIAKSGASGNVTSPQLHFEIRKSGAPVDPMSQLASN